MAQKPKPPKPPPSERLAALEQRIEELEQRLAVVEQMHVEAIKQARMSAQLHPEKRDDEN
jgi:type II secretory pathway component PulM